MISVVSNSKAAITAARPPKRMRPEDDMELLPRLHLSLQ
jgi:hypothetical protein